MSARSWCRHTPCMDCCMRQRVNNIRVSLLLCSQWKPQAVPWFIGMTFIYLGTSHLNIATSVDLYTPPIALSNVWVLSIALSNMRVLFQLIQLLTIRSFIIIWISWSKIQNLSGVSNMNLCKISLRTTSQKSQPITNFATAHFSCIYFREVLFTINTS